MICPAEPAITRNVSRENCSGMGTAVTFAGFSLSISSRETSHVGKIYDCWPGWVRVACDHCVRANTECYDRQRQDGAGGRVVEFLLVSGHLAYLEDCWAQCL